MPFIHRDGIKEALFDSLGWSDREWSRKLGGASYHLLFHFARAQLVAGCSVVIESNFGRRSQTEFDVLRRQVDYVPVQAVCHADASVLLQRYSARVDSGERHPGHVDHLNVEEYKARLLASQPDVLDLGCEVIRVDTTDFSAVDYEGIVSAILAASQKNGGKV
jgi:predicted kinase